MAADIAFDAVGQTYQPAEVALLEYHLHIPGPDPLTNADSEAARLLRSSHSGTPTALLDGKATDPLGGGPAESKKSYDTLRKSLDDVLKKNGQASIKMEVARTGDNVGIDAEVTDLTKTGDRVRLLSR